MPKELSQDLLRALKIRLRLMEVEALKNLLTTLRDGMDDKDFYELCDVLSSDKENYGLR